jgi:HTH-type transcriptional regulator, global nitrogen regulator NrpRI
MLGQEIRDPEGKLLAILKTLNNSSQPLGSYTIASRLKREGITLSERTVRYHLKQADAHGYTQSFGRGGRMITDEGRQEIKQARAVQHIGNVIDKLKMLAFQTTYSPEKRTGLIPINTSIIDKKDFKKALGIMKSAFKARICVSDLVAVAQEGQKLGSVVVPFGKIGLATVCSVAVNGVLLKAGIPTEYKFSGMLEILNSRPLRFVAAIDYAGTSLEPSEEFIRSGITGVNDVVRTGNGKGLGVFRTIPLPAKSAAEEKLARLKDAGIGGVYPLGGSHEPLFQVSIEMNRAGMVQLNGLNPAAAAVEAGIDIENFAGSGLIDYAQLQPVGKLQMARGDETDISVRE